MTILEIRRADSRGPDHLGELLTRMPCVVDPTSNSITIDDPVLPVDTFEEVLLYVDGRYSGWAVLDNGRLISDIRDPSPWFAL